MGNSLNVLNRIPVVLLIVFFAFYLGYQYFLFQSDSSSAWIQKKQYLQHLKQENNVLKNKVKTGKLFFATLETKKKQIRLLAKKLRKMKTQLSDVFDMAKFIRVTVTEAKRVGLTVVSFEPQKEEKKKYYYEQSFQMGVRGAYIQILAFLKRLARIQTIVRIRKLQLRPVTDVESKYVELAGKVELLAYRYAGSKADDIAQKARQEEKGFSK